MFLVHTKLRKEQVVALDVQQKEEGGDEHQNENETKFLSLPPIGQSSYNPSEQQQQQQHTNNDYKEKEIILNSNKPTNVGLVGSAKFELQYTCNICETRNKHKVSRLAYTKGVVITECKECNTRHLIADNLGWSKYWGEHSFEGRNNIEEYMKDVGRGDEVTRVSKDVFHLEQMLDVAGDVVENGVSVNVNTDGNGNVEDGNVFE